MSGWQDRAACRIAPDPDVFFPEGQGRIGQAAIRKATAYCDLCAVPVQCLSEALVRPVQGIWAGTTEGQREELREELAGHLGARRAS